METEVVPPPAVREITGPRCQVCAQAAPRYRCPRCMTRTCSLPCVKRHKAENECNGVRDKTAFVRTTQFTDLNLLNDYRFLEDVGRKTESATRDPTRSLRTVLPWHLKSLITQVQKRNTTLKLLPRTFTKRQKNKTKYYCATDRILWTVEWVFPQADAKHFDRHLDTDKVGDCLRKIFNPAETDSVVCHTLRGYLKHGLDKVTLLLKKEQCPANDQRYYEINPAKTLQKSLRWKVIVEYPTIHVVFNEKAGSYPRAAQHQDNWSSSESESETDEQEKTAGKTCDKTDKACDETDKACDKTDDKTCDKSDTTDHTVGSVILASETEDGQQTEGAPHTTMAVAHSKPSEADDTERAIVPPVDMDEVSNKVTLETEGGQQTEGAPDSAMDVDCSKPSGADDTNATLSKITDTQQ